MLQRLAFRHDNLLIQQLSPAHPVHCQLAYVVVTVEGAWPVPCTRGCSKVEIKESSGVPRDNETIETVPDLGVSLP